MPIVEPLILVICIMTLFGFKNVNAKEVYYTNEKGFSFTQEEYNFFKNEIQKQYKYSDEDFKDSVKFYLNL